MSQNRLLYVMDPMCSWCWGFAPVVQALATQAREAGVPMTLTAGGLIRDSRAVDTNSRQRYLGYWQEVSHHTGQFFDFERGLPEGMSYNTEPACRAMVVVRQLDASKTWPFVQRVQQAFYAEGVNVTLPAELVRLAGETGLPTKAFANGFDSSEAQQATEADFAWVQRLGIAGFPTLLAERNGQLSLLTNGYQPLQALSPLLGRWLEQMNDA